MVHLQQLPKLETVSSGRKPSPFCDDTDVPTEFVNVILANGAETVLFNEYLDFTQP